MLAEVRREIIRYELRQVAYSVTPYLRKGLSAEKRRKLVEEWKYPATAKWEGVQSRKLPLTSQSETLFAYRISPALCYLELRPLTASG